MRKWARFSALGSLLLVLGCSGSVAHEESDGTGGHAGDGDGDSTGDGDGTGGTSPTDLPTWEEIEARIDVLNTCADVMDCKAIGTRPCQSMYLNAAADVTELEADIEARLAQDYPDMLGCDASCACAFLLCSDEGKCVTEASQCEEPPDDSMKMICL